MKFSITMRTIVAFMVLAMGATCTAAASQAATYYTGTTDAKYVFFFIGDGLGLPQRAATEAYTGKEMLIDTFPAQGITSTQANNRFIVGSAASGTAMATGQITNIGMIGMAPDKTSVKSVAQLAKEQGRKVGIVSSVSIDHATPATFYAHVEKRSMYHDIDMQLAQTGFDYFAGGGLKDPKGTKKGVTSKGDALELARKNGYKIAVGRTAFSGIKNGDMVIAINDRLPDGKALPYQIDTRDSDITLAEFTAKGIEVLDNPKGFFMMVEGGKIDWACHANDAKAAIVDTIAFDEAVQEAVNFYKKHPKETLIVVTGDHECGGMTLGFAGTKYESDYDILKAQGTSFQEFTDEYLKDFVANCGSNCSFEAVQPLITKHFGIKFAGEKGDHMVAKPYQIAMIKDAYEMAKGGEDVYSSNKETKRIFGGYNPLAVAVTHVLNNMAGLAWTSYKHTAVPVATSALGVGAEVFNGSYHQSEIAKKIMSTMGVKPAVHTASGMVKTDVASN